MQISRQSYSKNAADSLELESKPIRIAIVGAGPELTATLTIAFAKKGIAVVDQAEAIYDLTSTVENPLGNLKLEDSLAPRKLESASASSNHNMDFKKRKPLRY